MLNVDMVFLLQFSPFYEDSLHSIVPFLSSFSFPFSERVGVAGEKLFVSS